MTAQGFSASTERWNGAGGFEACGWWLLSTSTGLLPLAIVIATVLGILPHRSSWAVAATLPKTSPATREMR
ncbi:hypothetical protein [Mycobacterium sp. MFM001]|uniref:hypothetical protein n=1 Tax=Mycobacterium sp. MFM001 TaxID=2049453 RepID=UPI000E2FDD71|nr:hypothetical protein [Mycobacterium sp. MFM001]